MFDTVIVGGGVCGAVVALKLSRAGKRVLLLEAGTSNAMDPARYRSYLDQYYAMGGLRSSPNGPYPVNLNALSPGTPSTDPYYVQPSGKTNFLSDYLRMLGGSTLHWQGTSLRLVPNDFKMRTKYGRAADWPIGYDDLEPSYREAESIIGVSADVADQQNLGVWFAPGYTYPMRKMPQSCVDKFFIQKLTGGTVTLAGKPYPLRVVSIPMGRNSAPNPNYDAGNGYVPVSAVGDRDAGNRCQGNSNCLPLCPVQAKYSALKTIQAAQETGRLEVRSQCIATKLNFDSATGKITSVEYKQYYDPANPVCRTQVVSGRVVVLAAHSIQNAILMMASALIDKSGQLGRNLMDHPYVGVFGLAPEPVYPFRGPDTTSGVESLRDGDFRSTHASFRASLANWGWSGEPVGTVTNLLGSKLFGRTFREQLRDRMTRMVKLGVMFEQLPDPNNRVTIDPAQVDRLGNFRPILTYAYANYTLDGIMALLGNVWPAIAQRAGIEDATKFPTPSPNSGSQPVQYGGKTFNVMGSGHIVGTHRMAANENDGVVNPNLRSWAHPNLYTVGAGSMVTIGTANPTLTAAALSARAADAMLLDLR